MPRGTFVHRSRKQLKRWWWRWTKRALPTSAVSYWGIPRILAFFFFFFSSPRGVVPRIRICIRSRAWTTSTPYILHTYSFWKKRVFDQSAAVICITHLPVVHLVHAVFRTECFMRWWCLTDGPDCLPSRGGRQGHVLHCSSRILVNLIGLQQYCTVVWYSIV